MQEIVNRIYEYFEKAKFESTHIIYLKNPVTVGTNENGPIRCTYINRAYNPVYEYDHISINVILDERSCDLYGKDYDFEFVQFKPEFEFKPTFIVDHTENNFTSGTIEILPNALELILDELNSSGDEWITYQRDLQIRSRWFHRNAVWKHTPQFEKHHRELTWEERKEWAKVKGEIEELMWRRPVNYEYKDFKRMEEMGEEKWKEEQQRLLNIIKSIDLDK